MKKNRRIKASSLPARSPVATGILYWLLLDRFHAPEWAYGAFWTFFALVLIVYAIALFRDDYADAPGFGERD